MRKLTRTEANFENLLEAALLVEGHCSHASRGCCCRGCSECEENYSENEEEGLTLAELIDRELGPNTDVPYGDDPRADDDEYDMDEEQETFANLSQNQSKLANAMEILRITDPNREKNLANSAKDAAKRVMQTAVDALKKP